MIIKLSIAVFTSTIKILFEVPNKLGYPIIINFGSVAQFDFYLILHFDCCSLMSRLKIEYIRFTFPIGYSVAKLEISNGNHLRVIMVFQ